MVDGGWWMVGGKQLSFLLALAWLLAATQLPAADEQEALAAGLQADGRIVVPTNQILTPAGKQITFPGRPVDLLLSPDEKTLIVKNMRGLVFIDETSARITQTLASPAGFSVTGLLLIGERIYSSDVASHLCVAERGANGKYVWVKPIPMARPAKGEAHPAGLAWDGKENLWAASTRGNNIQRINLGKGRVEEVVPVGVAPYTVLCISPKKLYVSNWGGDPPKEGDPRGLSSGTPIRVDPTTTVANDGTVSAVELVGGKWKQTRTIRVGLHPCGMSASPQKEFLYVANANSDSVSVIDTNKDEVVETISCRPRDSLPFGSGCNALALLEPTSLLVANGTNNCIASVLLGNKAAHAGSAGATEQSSLAGLIPTGWYPGAICLSSDRKKLFVANIKGHGSLSQPRPVEKGKQSKDYLGSVSLIDVPDAQQLARYTGQVNANNRLSYSLAGLEKPRAEAQPRPVPERHGEPSLFKHVLYIIKENRTYDQVLGDMPEGNGDKRLALFGAEVTPNQHALAREFTLFDNFYCSGVLSVDGHHWTDAAYVTDYLERAFGGFTRSYPDNGSDPLAFASSGFLWNNALAHGRTIRNYGEFVNDEKWAPKGTTWSDLYGEYKDGTRRTKLALKANVAALEPYTHPGYPWFPLIMPDVYRARLFLEDLQAFEEKGQFPNLIFLTLPCNHTTGTKPGFPTPRASVADNDLALGRIVEAVSKSKFWPETCIFVVEDDPQNGFDHVDAHRTVALVISPYTKRKFVDHTHYNQTGMVKTIELLLGLPCMNQMDLSATAMRHCFQPEPDLAPYAHRENLIALDEMNPDPSKLKGQALHWARKSLELELDEGDAADEDTLNRILWHSVWGDDKPYPEELAGATTSTEH